MDFIDLPWAGADVDSGKGGEAGDQEGAEKKGDVAGGDGRRI